ncbi:hypothetical protein THAOC_24929, partial [Thalassiosira oceanica]
ADVGSHSVWLWPAVICGDVSDKRDSQGKFTGISAFDGDVPMAPCASTRRREEDARGEKKSHGHSRIHSPQEVARVARVASQVDEVATAPCYGMLTVPKPKSTKPNATKHGKVDHLAMANIGRRCTVEVAEECNPEQNRPLVPILASAKAVDTAKTDNFGLEVECRSTPRNYTSRRTPPFEA